MKITTQFKLDVERLAVLLNSFGPVDATALLELRDTIERHVPSSNPQLAEAELRPLK